MPGQKTLKELLQRSLLNPPPALKGVPHYEKALRNIKEYLDERETTMKHHILKIVEAGRRGDDAAVRRHENAMYDGLEKLLNNFEMTAEFFIEAAKNSPK
jgi:hypothetical protein